MENKLVEELKVLRVKAGETLVVECSQDLTPEQREHLKDAFELAGVKGLVLSNGMKVAAVQS